MYSHTHFLLPFFLGLVLTKFNLFSWELALFAGIVGMIIDLDHYITHIFKAKRNKYSLKDTWNNFLKQHPLNQRSFVHHWQGLLIFTLLFLVVLFFNWQISLMLALGYYTHLLLDLPYRKDPNPLRFKLGKFQFKETHAEIVLDILLLKGIALILWF